MHQTIYSNRLTSIDDLPIKQTARHKTDLICIFLASMLFITTFILAMINLSRQNYYKINFPTDSSSIPCSYDANQQYPMLYLTDLNNINKRVCVSVCPKQNDTKLICRTNNQVQSCNVAHGYQTEPGDQRLGGFCVPNNQQHKDIWMSTLNLQHKWDFFNTYDTIFISLLTSIAIGFIWFILVQAAPSFMANFVTILAALVAISVGILLLADNPKGFQKYFILRLVVSLILFLTAACIIIFIIFYKRRTTLMKFFLDWSTKWASKSCSFVLWVVVYIIFTIAFTFLIYAQHVCFLSSNTPTPQVNQIYLKNRPSIIFFILNVVQFIWGCQFLKDSFNFIISGQSAQYYLEPNTDMAQGCCGMFGRLICYHVGSVLGGAFLNGFFNILAFMAQSLRCYPNSICRKFAIYCDSLSSSKFYLFNFTRTDAYSYISLTGIPYCNACRHCQKILLINHNKQYIGLQSLKFFYRNCSYIACVGINFIVAYIIEKGKLGAVNIESLIIIVMVSYVGVTYWVDFHANGAEGLHIVSMLDRSFGKRRIQTIHAQQKQQLLNILQSDIVDGQC